MNRRQAIFALLSLGMANVAAAAQPSVPARIGFLSFGTPETTGNLLKAFKEGMRDLGYREGIDYQLVIRSAQGNTEREPDPARELVALQPDVILVGANRSILALQNATNSIPIVFTVSIDPVSAGIVKSLAHPGGNATGLSLVSTETMAKSLELIHATVPRVSRLAVLWNPSDSTSALTLKNVQYAAKSLNLSMLSMEAPTPTAIESAFSRMKRDGVGAVVILPDSFLFVQRRQLAELALRNGLPTIFHNREAVAAGGLMGYGTSLVEPFRRAATFVHKILKGAQPADLPVEQPTKFELTINMKTAKALGIEFPQSVLLSATEVIE